jgi:hypothetical protein
MNAIVRKFLLLAAAGAATFILLSALGMPSARILTFAPLLLCVGMHLFMGHGDHGGREHQGHSEDSE